VVVVVQYHLAELEAAERHHRLILPAEPYLHPLVVVIVMGKVWVIKHMLDHIVV
jgi:hypothetical protein